MCGKRTNNGRYSLASHIKRVHRVWGDTSQHIRDGDEKDHFVFQRWFGIWITKNINTVETVYRVYTQVVLIEKSDLSSLEEHEVQYKLFTWYPFVP